MVVNPSTAKLAKNALTLQETNPLNLIVSLAVEDKMSHHAVNVSAFIMGAVGLAIAIWGVFVKGDTKQTLFGLFGGLLFWTGWIHSPR